MKKEGKKKNLWALAFLALGVAGGLGLGYKLAMVLLIRFVTGAMAGETMGIIGGADGPTAIFVTGVSTTGAGAIGEWLIPLAALAVGIWGYCRWRKCNK